MYASIVVSNLPALLRRSFSLACLAVGACLILQACADSRKTAAPAPTRTSPYWARIYNISGDDVFNTVHQTADGGFLAAGLTRVRYPDHDALIVKTDAFGTVLWRHGVGDKEYDEFLDAQETPDGGYLAMGNSRGAGDLIPPGRDQTLFVKYDARGRELWQKVIPNHRVNSFAQTADGSIAATGTSRAFGDEYGMSVALIGPQGENRWLRIYGRGRGDVIHPTADGGYIVLGSVGVIGGDETLIVKFDANGAVQWQRQYAAGRLNSIMQTADGGYMAAGAAGSATGNDQSPGGRRTIPMVPTDLPNLDGWLLKLDRDGYDLWQRVYGGQFEEEFVKVRRTGDGNNVVFGTTKSYGVGNGDLWLLKVDGFGNILMQRTIGGLSKEWASDVRPTAENGYIMAGTTQSFGKGTHNLFLMNVNEAGDIPDCTLPLFSTTAAEPKQKGILRSESRALSAGDAVSFMTNTSAVPSFDIAMHPAGVCPPTPKIIAQASMLDMGTAMAGAAGIARNVRIINIGAAELIFKETRIAGPDDGPGIALFMKRLWTRITRWGAPITASYSLNSSCKVIGPGLSCDATVTVLPSRSGEAHVRLLISSNDPETPVLEIPIKATVQ